MFLANYHMLLQVQKLLYSGLFSNMAAILVFFCFHANWSFWPHSRLNVLFYYMAKPVLGKSQHFDWFFLSLDFAVRTISVEKVQAVYFCFGAKPANS